MTEHEAPSGRARPAAEAARKHLVVPANVPGAQAIIRRLCQLHADVVAVIDPDCRHAADCFCGESGFWPLKSPAGFRNELLAVDFIEAAVRARLAEMGHGPHRWWHDGRGYRHAFCLFCGLDYLAVTQSEFADDPCPSPRAAGGEDEAQRILSGGAA